MIEEEDDKTEGETTTDGEEGEESGSTKTWQNPAAKASDLAERPGFRNPANKSSKAQRKKRKKKKKR